MVRFIKVIEDAGVEIKFPEKAEQEKKPEVVEEEVIEEAVAEAVEVEEINEKKSKKK